MLDALRSLSDIQVTLKSVLFQIVSSEDSIKNVVELSASQSLHHYRIGIDFGQQSSRSVTSTLGTCTFMLPVRI
jgi:hypothetical protein